MLTRRNLLAAGTVLPLAGCATMGGLGANLSGAIQELLKLASTRAVSKLGTEGGLLNNVASKIGLDQALGGVNLGPVLQTMNQLGLLGGLERRINQAAERGIAAVGPFITDSINGLSIKDAQSIINGGGDAATQFMKAAIANQVADRLGGNVSGALQALDVVGQLAGIAGLNLGNVSLGNLAKNITGKASDVLFAAIGSEERAIRANPAASGSELIKQVFKG
jgi:hypothetical protein